MKAPRYALGIASVLGMSGCDLHFAAPQRLWLLWLVPVLIVFLCASAARHRRQLQSLVAPKLLPRLVNGARPSRRWRKRVLILVAVTALILALADPKYGFVWEDATQRGVDIVVALDVSDSMNATDDGAGTTPRLDLAKRKIIDLLRELQGDRVALVAFAGEAFLECPLTSDYDALLSYVDALTPDSISAKGTDLEAALRVSMQALAGGNAASGAVLLISDGEDTLQGAADAAADANAAGFRVYAIGVGKLDGSPIPGADGAFRRDARGELVLSRLEENGLKAVTNATGGLYTRATVSDADLAAVYTAGIKRALVDNEGRPVRRRHYYSRYQWLVALAMLALTLEALSSERGRR